MNLQILIEKRGKTYTYELYFRKGNEVMTHTKIKKKVAMILIDNGIPFEG